MTLDPNSNEAKVLIALAELAEQHGYTGYDSGPQPLHHWETLEAETGLSRSQIASFLVSLEARGLFTGLPRTSDSGAHLGQGWINARGMGQASQLIAIRGRSQVSLSPSNKRLQVLGTLVDAYLSSDREFVVRHEAGLPDPEVIHPGLSAPLYVPWSHLDALAREGFIYLDRSGRRTTINIPTSVITSYEQNDRRALQFPPGEARANAIAQSQVTYHMTTNNTNVHGGQVNMAIQSHNVTQHGSNAVHQHDVESLISVLRSIGLTGDGEASLRASLESDRDEGGRYRYGQAVAAWVSNATSGATGNLIAVGGLEAMKFLVPAFEAFF